MFGLMNSLARVLLVALVLSGSLLTSSESAKAQGRSDAALAALDRTPHVPNQVLVQFRFGVTEESRDSIRGRIQAQVDEVVVAQERRPDMRGDLELWNLPPGLEVARAVRELDQDPAIEFAEPNWIYQHQAVPNDTYYANGSLWGMYGDASPLKQNEYGSQAGEAWGANKTDCKDIYVGIIDEGLMHFHEDLVTNVWRNPIDIPDGVDNDHNGYVDDINGWDFASNDNSVYDGTGDDHGTHVSGTIAAIGGNGKGVAGVCWSGIKLISAKFLGPAGGTTANAIKAVDYLTDLKVNRGVNIVATNNSWGGGGYSQGLYDAIDRANTANILFVAAAGNSGKNIDVAPSYPASYSNANIITVAAIDSRGNLASFSNYGKTTVDLGAPGVGIWSTIPKKNSQSGYSAYSGTSMATPHVTGAAALYAATHSGSTAKDIKDALLGAVVTYDKLKDKTVTGGRLNICCP